MEKFNVSTISYVTGYSVSTINSWSAKKSISTREGLAVPDIIEFLRSPKKTRENGIVDKKAAERLRVSLEVMGALEPSFELEAAE